MAFIHNDLSIPFDYRVYRLLMDQALQDGNIDQSSLLLLAGSNLSKRPRRRFEEQLQTIDPLIHQLPRMNKHQSAHSPTSDQPGCNNRLAEGRRGHQNARIMLQYSLRCLALQLGELPMELQVQGTSLNALVIYDHGGSQCFQECKQFSHATARQGDVLGKVFRTTDYPGFTVSRQPHCLCPIEFRIGKSGHTDDPIAQRWGKTLFGDIQSIGQSQDDPVRRWSGYLELLPVTEAFLFPRYLIRDRRKSGTRTELLSATGESLHKLFHVAARQASH